MTGFVFNSILLGVGLAMDAFSVSIANGLNEPGMSRRRQCLIAGTYGFFQFLMPVIGWTCVHELVRQFRAFEPWIPWIALGLLLWIGGKMLLEGIRQRGGSEAGGDVPAGGAAQEAEKTPAGAAAETAQRLTVGMLILQGIATSIDALSVGFAIANYGRAAAFGSAVIIAAVTFLICIGGLLAGRKLGEKLTGKADILGGCILIFIGLEIFVKGVFL